MTAVKICGITASDSLRAAAKSGASFAGLVFYPRSPRYVTPAQAAAIASGVPDTDIALVGLFRDPADEEISAALDHVALSLIQLHGNETPDRVRKIREKFGLPVIKALPVSEKKDLESAAPYMNIADWLLFDSRSPQGGGSGQSFDWEILKDFQSPLPWMLAGGLNAGNISAALGILAPEAVDVSSGVEDTPGQKNPDKIKEFIESVVRTG